MFNTILVLLFVLLGLLCKDVVNGIDGYLGPSLAKTGINSRQQIPGVKFSARTKDYVFECGRTSGLPETGSLYDIAFSLYKGETCNAAFEQFLNSSEPIVAYDVEDGKEVSIAEVFGGKRHHDVCYCLALQNVHFQIDLDMCFLVGSDAIVRLESPSEGIRAMKSEPRSNRTLPKCGEFDQKQELSASNSTASNSTATLVGIAATTTAITASKPLSSRKPGEQFNQSDKIALGVGIGMGLPAILLAGAGLWCMRNRK